MVENIFFLYFILGNLYRVQKFMAICWSNRYHLNTHKKHTEKQKIISIKLFYKNRSILSNNIFVFLSILIRSSWRRYRQAKLQQQQQHQQQKKQSISLRFNLIKYKINFTSCSYSSFLLNGLFYKQNCTETRQLTNNLS